MVELKSKSPAFGGASLFHVRAYRGTRPLTTQSVETGSGPPAIERHTCACVSLAYAWAGALSLERLRIPRGARQAILDHVFGHHTQAAGGQLPQREPDTGQRFDPGDGPHRR